MDDNIQKMQDLLNENAQLREHLNCHANDDPDDSSAETEYLEEHSADDDELPDIQPKRDNNW